MGLLGVITEVTFQCEPEFNLVTIPPFDGRTAINNYADMPASYLYFPSIVITHILHFLHSR